ncbi:hypothetical protein [Pseudarthrobacter sp. H2]|uniref:hypothetical protein n=1 Tax=Pseudarthrobacter sp. H2 TaxID=3418415 RepID=UPI003CED9962
MRNDFLKITKTTAVNSPKVILLGVDTNGLYTNLTNDTILSKTLPGSVAGNRRPAVFWNVSNTVSGGSLVLENGNAVRARNTAGTYQAIFVPVSDNSTDLRALGSGGGKLTGTGGTGPALKWGANGDTLGFFGSAAGVKPTANPAAATDAATTQALVNDLRAKLIGLGLIGQGDKSPVI